MKQKIYISKILMQYVQILLIPRMIICLEQHEFFQIRYFGGYFYQTSEDVKVTGPQTDIEVLMSFIYKSTE